MRINHDTKIDEKAPKFKGEIGPLYYFECALKTGGSTTAAVPNTLEGIERIEECIKLAKEMIPKPVVEFKKDFKRLLSVDEAISQAGHVSSNP